MKYLVFIRHSQLEKPYEDYSKLNFEELNKLATCEISPSINSKSDKLIQNSELLDPSKIDVIFHSNSKRGLETARLIKKLYSLKDIDLIELNQLKEVDFNIKDLVTLEEYKQTGLGSIRPRLFSAIIKSQNENIENYQSISRRIEFIYKYLQKTEKENILFVTHGFFMRFLYLYFINGVRDLSALSINQLINAPNPSYLEGFRVKL
jgi:broad specificity phosphatase PhoE